MKTFNINRILLSAVTAILLVLAVVFSLGATAPGLATVQAAAGGIKGKPTKTTTTTTTTTTTVPTTTTSTTTTPTTTTTTTTEPTSTTTSPTSGTCTGTTVTPANASTLVAASAPGDTLCFTPGTYTLTITPKDGQTYDGGNRAAIIDGQGIRQYAIRASGVPNVTIRGFTIRNHATPLQSGAIHSFGSTGWTIDNNQITRNNASAVATDSGVRVINNLLDHNGQQGYAAHGSNILYEGNEIAYNNENLAVDATWEAGGGKAWATQDATFRGNHVHHNGGNGLWDDTNNIRILYDGNNVHDNWGAGIYHEIGYNATIVNNTVTNNGTSTSQGGGQDLGWLWDAGIQLRSSQGLDATNPTLISGNTVVGNYNGIALLDSPATGCTNSGEGAYGPCKIANVLVSNNDITMSIGASGAVQDGSGNGIFTSRNVHWTGNRYRVSTLTHPNDGHAYGWFAWNNGWPSWSNWQGYGNDTTGTFTVGP